MQLANATWCAALLLATRCHKPIGRVAFKMQRCSTTGVDQVWRYSLLGGIDMWERHKEAGIQAGRPGPRHQLLCLFIVCGRRMARQIHLVSCRHTAAVHEHASTVYEGWQGWAAFPATIYVHLERRARARPEAA